MRARICLAVLILAGVVGYSESPVPKAATRPAPGPETSTLDDQVDLAVTVYNSDIALVRDVRNIRVPDGSFDLRFMDIAATVNPATVHFRSLTEPGRLDVLEQNYEYDFLDPEKLLKKYIGRDVTLVRTRYRGRKHQGGRSQSPAPQLQHGPVWQIGDEIVTGLGADHLRFPKSSRQPVHAPDVDLDAAEQRRRATPR